MRNFCQHARRAATILITTAAMSVAAAAPLTAQQLRADLQLARTALEETHGGIYRYATKAKVDRAFEQAAAAMERPMEPAQFQGILATTIAALRCGHTGVMPSPALKAAMEQALLLPQEVKLIEDRLFVLRDFDGAGKLAGREIVSVNGVPTTTIIARLLAASPGDGFIATGRAQRVARKFREDLFTHFGMHGQFSLGLGDPIGATATMPGQTMAAIKLASASRYPQDRRQTRFAELSLLDDGTIAHLKIFNFSAEDEDDDGPSILRKAFEKMATSGTQTLLLDLRDNGGGEDVLGKRLFSHLVDAPFRYYEELTVKRAGVSYAEHVEGEAGIPARALTPRADGLYSLGSHPNLGMQKAALPTFSGRVIALINGRSFSTTAELITQLHDKQRATFVGEESGGAYHGNSSGEDVTLVLPNSRLKVAIPLVTYKLAVRGSHPNGRGVVPEYKVVPGIQDYLRGHDVVLEKALALARAR